MLKLKKIDYWNFRLLQSTGVALTEGLFFVGGENSDSPGASSNMSGKSTLAVGFVWCLYGTDLSGKRLADNVVNSAETFAYVNAYFEDDNGECITVKRERYNGTPPSGKFANYLYVYKDGNLVKEGSADEIQPYIDSLFGNVNLFLASHVFAFSKATPFAEATDTEQKRLFDLLINAGDLDIALQNSKAKLNETKEILTGYETDILTLDGNKEYLFSRKTEIEESASDNLKELDVLYKKTEQELDGASNALESALGMRTSGLERLSQAQAYLTMVKEGNASKRKISQDSVAVQKSVISESENRLAELEDLKENIPCPFCEQSISGAHLDKLKTAINKTIKTAEKAIVKFEKELTAIEEEIKKATSPVEKIQVELEEKIYPAVTEAEDDYEVLETELYRIDKEISIKKKVSSDEAKKIEDELATIEKGKEIIETKKKKLEIDIDLYSFWVEAFGARGIRAYRLDMITPILNAYAELYSEYLYGDGTVLRYSTQTKTKSGHYRDKFEAALYKKEGDNYVKIETSLSAGQAMRRDIVHTFAMAEIAKELDKKTVSLLILDELFVSIDQQGMSAIIRMLDECMEEDDTVLVIEHSDDLKTSFDRHITVSRFGGTATIEVDR